MKIVDFSLFESFKELRKKMGISKEKIVSKSSNTNYNSYNFNSQLNPNSYSKPIEKTAIKESNSATKKEVIIESKKYTYSKPVEKTITNENIPITKTESYNNHSNSSYSNSQTKNTTIDIPSIVIKEIAGILKNSYGQISCDENGIPLKIRSSIQNNNLKYYYMYDYFPKKKYGDRDDQTLVFNLKNGINVEENAYLISRGLLECFSNLSEYTIIPIAASNSYKNERRYKRLLEIICKNTGLKNGYYAIKILTETEAKHLTGKKNDLSSHIQIDSSLIKTDKIIIFDDVITKGESIENMKVLLQKERKNFVITAFLFAKTSHNI